ncbi:hypothetical protein LIER_05865 [Lithospermum erythrorhizon]|uniref:Uncharacterized protein n=1 Tax=Lithospermum erythrorhizon TaxID=34254 RepID=A0AAV3P322_LITER
MSESSHTVGLQAPPNINTTKSAMVLPPHNVVISHVPLQNAAPFQRTSQKLTLNHPICHGISNHVEQNPSPTFRMQNPALPVLRIQNPTPPIPSTHGDGDTMILHEPSLMSSKHHISQATNNPSCANPKAQTPTGPKPSYAQATMGDVLSAVVEDYDWSNVANLRPIEVLEGKPCVVFKKSDKARYFSMMKYILIWKFLHGRPTIAVIKGSLSTWNLKVPIIFLFFRGTFSSTAQDRAISVHLLFDPDSQELLQHLVYLLK